MVQVRHIFCHQRLWFSVQRASGPLDAGLQNQNQGEACFLVLLRPGYRPLRLMRTSHMCFFVPHMCFHSCVLCVFWTCARGPCDCSVSTHFVFSSLRHFAKHLRQELKHSLF